MTVNYGTPKYKIEQIDDVDSTCYFYTNYGLIVPPSWDSGSWVFTTKKSELSNEDEIYYTTTYRRVLEYASAMQMFKFTMPVPRALTLTYKGYEVGSGVQKTFYTAGGLGWTFKFYLSSRNTETQIVMTAEEVALATQDGHFYCMIYCKGENLSETVSINSDYISISSNAINYGTPTYGTPAY